jgi:crotonobetainyl-CoA:carnitine CoA-transferase CaiB-like acyl-CoA transferase
MSQANGPLWSYKVLDLTRARAGPTAVRQLADWGADVIKIELPDGVKTDGLAGNRHGFDFQNLHRNKRSMTLNLKSDRGREIFLDMVRGADVVIENFRPGVKHRLGIDYEACKAANLAIVYGSISGFGQEGPISGRAGLDQIAQGMGGLMSVTGLPGQGPVRVGIPIADLTAGFNLAMGVLVALLEREKSGLGQWVHTSLLEAQITMMDFQAARYLKDGEVPGQAGNNHPTGIPTGVFETSDGAINIQAGSPHMYVRLCDMLGAKELSENPDYKDPEGRLANRDQLNAEISVHTKKWTSDKLIEALAEAGVPCGPIYDVGQTFNDEQVKGLNMDPEIDHPMFGKLKVVGQAVKLERTPQVMRRPTPEMGQHTDEIMADMGYGPDEIAALKAEKLI